MIHYYLHNVVLIENGYYQTSLRVSCRPSRVSIVEGLSRALMTCSSSYQGVNSKKFGNMEIISVSEFNSHVQQKEIFIVQEREQKRKSN